MKTTSRRAKRIAWVALAFGFVATVSVARAEAWYYINRQPAPLDIAQVMAERGLPFGYYWLQPNGNWGLRAAPMSSEISMGAAQAFRSAGQQKVQIS
jgi:hypothetical protein